MLDYVQFSVPYNCIEKKSKYMYRNLQMQTNYMILYDNDCGSFIIDYPL